MATNYKIPGTPGPSPEDEGARGAEYSHDPVGYDPATASFGDDYDFELAGQRVPMPAQDHTTAADKYARSQRGK